MIHRIFTIYDSKAEAYLQPFYMKTNGEALRAFTDSVNDPNHQFNKHPEDYTMFFLGFYDDAAASFDIQAAHTSLGTALEYKTQREIPFGDPQLPHLAEVRK